MAEYRPSVSNPAVPFTCVRCRQRKVMTYAEAMTRTDKGVDDALFSRLSAQFSADEIIELTALVGYQNLSSKFNAALGIPPQGFCLIQAPKGSRKG